MVISHWSVVNLQMEPTLVKLFIGELYSEVKLLTEAEQRLVKLFGKIDFHSAEFDFNISDYYKAEMGWPIYRKFISFESPVGPGELAEIKTVTNEIEVKLAKAGARKVNLDPGYMDFNKVVLASGKFNGQKIYLDKGIYADPTLWYEKGEFKPYPFAFPDFKSGLYQETFLQIRAIYKNALQKEYR